MLNAFRKLLVWLLSELFSPTFTNCCSQLWGLPYLAKTIMRCGRRTKNSLAVVCFNLENNICNSCSKKLLWNQLRSANTSPRYRNEFRSFGNYTSILFFDGIELELLQLLWLTRVTKKKGGQRSIGDLQNARKCERKEWTGINEFAQVKGRRAISIRVTFNWNWALKRKSNGT